MTPTSLIPFWSTANTQACGDKTLAVGFNFTNKLLYFNQMYPQVIQVTFCRTDKYTTMWRGRISWIDTKSKARKEKHDSYRLHTSEQLCQLNRCIRRHLPFLSWERCKCLCIAETSPARPWPEPAWCASLPPPSEPDTPLGSRTPPGRDTITLYQHIQPNIQSNMDQREKYAEWQQNHVTGHTPNMQDSCEGENTKPLLKWWCNTTRSTASFNCSIYLSTRCIFYPAPIS